MKNRLHAAGRVLLMLALVLVTFAGLPFGSADAASYKIKHSRLDDGNEYYYVYQNSEQLDETPTFITTPNDVFTSQNTENGVRITFFRSYNLYGNDQADALCRHLVDSSKAVKRHAGWYESSSTKYGYRESVTIVYLVEGLNPRWEYVLEALWDWDPFYNKSGTRLSLEFGAWGERTESFSELWNQGCSGILTIFGRTKDENSSFGMIFTEGSDRHIVRRYCMYETWD